MPGRCTPLFHSTLIEGFKMDNHFMEYFKNSNNQSNGFNPPATEYQIQIIERQLGIALPVDYRLFFKFTNGFEGFINDFYVILSPIEKIPQETLDNLGDEFPWAFFIGSNGNLEMFVIDTRTNPFQFGLLPFIGSEDDFIPLGNTFEIFISKLYSGTAYDKN